MFTCIRPVCHRLSGTLWRRGVSRMQRAGPAAGQAIGRCRVHRDRARLSRGHLSPRSRRSRRSSAFTSTTTRLGIRPARPSLDEIAAARQFRERAAAIDATTLSPSNQLDREQLLLAIDSRILTLEIVRPWARDPDTYSSGLTNTAYIMIKRAFAPPEERLRQPDRAREGDAGRARRGAQEPREPAADLHRDRHRADRRQPRLLPDRGRRRRSPP